MELQFFLKKGKGLFFFVFFLGFGFLAYWYPRFLVSLLGEKSVWISYSYTYGMGGFVFVSSLIWIFTIKKQDLRQKEELRWLLALLLGFFTMMAFHGLWTLWVSTLPFKG